MNLEETGKSLGLVTPSVKMWGGQTCPGLCPAWNLQPAGLKSRFPAVYFWSSLENSDVNITTREYLGFFPSCSGKSVGLFEPWEPKGRCPFLGKESFLEKWGLGILISSQLGSCYHVDCGRRKDYLQSLTRNNVFLGNVWRSTDIWCPIKWRRNFSWLEWSKWKTKFFVGAPDIGNNHIWGFWGTNDVAWAAFLPWILFYLWLPVNCDNGISTIQICGNSAAVETLTQGYAGSIRLWHPRAEGMVLSEVAQSRRKI